MNRRAFIKQSCTTCAALTVLASCSLTRHITGTLNEDGITVDIENFKEIKSGKLSWRSFIVVSNESLQFPICVYRLSEQDYSAVWMQCTHQGAELQVAGNYLQCPAHGSEFNNAGKVTNGPASNDLRAFPVILQNNQLFIDLRKQ